MKRIKRIVATTGTYIDHQGNEKKQYANVGTLFERPDGSQCIKLESIPLGWNGWANFYDLDNNSQASEPRSAAAKSVPQELDDEIPF